MNGLNIKVWTVGKINKYIRSMFQDDVMLSGLFCEGEISNLKYHSSGHIYFSCRDATGSINCVMFKTFADTLRFKLKDGMKIIMYGSVSVYEKSGQYQIYVETAEPLGLGNLYAELEQLKNKLNQEGIFDSSHKKKLPPYPETIAVITSPTGAVIRDISNVAKRRSDAVKLVIVPVNVQGDAAPAQIAAALKLVNEWKKANVIILAKGGGASEDMRAFNNEAVVRAVYASKIPVISAIGHQIDYTLCDFAADVRAETPSAAAEIAVYDKTLLNDTLRNKLALMRRLISEKHADLGIELGNLCEDLDILVIEKLTRSEASVYKLLEKIIGLTNSAYEAKTRRFADAVSRLELLSPLNIIKKGYSVAYRNGERLFSADKLNLGDNIEVVFSDSKLTAQVTDIDMTVGKTMNKDPQVTE